MTQDRQSEPQPRHRNHTRLWLSLAVVLVVLALILVPPLVSINRYQARITRLVSDSLGRPVRLSSVELRMLPRPGFLITNLTVDEDPAYGAEPVLHANTVLASVRFLPLWRGELQISRIRVDEASLNVVRTASGQWNLDAIFHNAATNSSRTGGKPVALPLMEATSSRINIKNGNEKLPFSLLDADASVSKTGDGEWRIRLRGQPARTDVSLDPADTGIMRIDATVRRGGELRKMPIHLDMDWRQAQLGQLSRLILGSDEGWRGDLTGELHLDGTGEFAHVRTRLRASGVHRAEFAPAAPLDFDASCGFDYRYPARSMEHVLCDSPIGSGRARLTGQLPGADQPPQLTLELDRVPAQVGLDILRTVRNNLDPDLQTEGAISGKMTYDRSATQAPAQPVHPRHHAGKNADPPPVPTPLTGAFTVDGLKISANSLSKPILVPKLTLEPAPLDPGQPPALETSVPLAAGGPTPLTVAAKLSPKGFQVGVHGTAALPRLRELAHVAGIAEGSILTQIASEPAALDLSIDGSWLPSLSGDASSPANTNMERMVGTVALHDATWKSDFLANPVVLKSAILHLEDGGLRWDPLDFVYGPIAGTATLQVAAACEAPKDCTPHFTVHFSSLNIADLQAAILGARKPGTLVSTLLDRFKRSTSTAWPQLEGDLEADTLSLGPFALNNLSAAVKISAAGAEVSSLQAGLLGGKLSAKATLTTGDKPSYQVEGEFAQLNAAKVGQLAGMRWTGRSFDGSTQLQLTGYTAADLAASAKGALRFAWSRGTVAGGAALPPALTRFDKWTADAAVAGRVITLQQNQIQRGSKKSDVQAYAAFGTPAKVVFTSPQPNRVAKR